jgi:multicomponent Na+:H+ antiporter subunit E
MSARNALPAPVAGAAASVVVRALSFFVIWVILIGTEPPDLIVGLAGAAAATWVSLLLVPAGRGPVPLLAAAVLIARLPVQSFLAGVDVARRALDPRLPLHPGFVSVPTRLPPGPTRNAFRALMSLQPGSLPVSTEAEGNILVHCLDMNQPVAAQMAAQETVFLRFPGQTSGHG